MEGAGGDACEKYVICDTRGLKAKITFIIVKVKTSSLCLCILPVCNEWRSSLLTDDKQELITTYNFGAEKTVFSSWPLRKSEPGSPFSHGRMLL